MRVSFATKFIVASLACIMTASAASAQQKATFTVGVSSTSFAVISPRVVSEMGLFDKHGLSANFVVMDNAAAAAAAVIAKSIEFATLGPAEIVIAQSQGQDLVPVLVGYTSFAGSLVLAKSVAEKLGVSANAPTKDRLKALDGLLIATPSPSSAYTLGLKGAAAAQGANIRFTYMAQPAMDAALRTGAVQGYMGGAPFWALPIVQGTGVLWISGPKNEVPAENTPANTTYLGATRDFATKNPDLIKRVKAAFQDLAEAIDKRPADVKAVIGKLNPTLDAATLDLLFTTEAPAWKMRPFAVKEMVQDISYVKAGGGGTAERIDKIDPASLLLKD